MRIGIDLGGTKIEGAVLTDDGTVLDRRRLATPQGDYGATMAAIGKLVRQLSRHGGCRCPIGIGIPGALSAATGRIKNANSTCLIGQDLKGDLETILKRPVRLANDADCFTLSEAVDGAAAGAKVVFGVILGTGVGGGIAVDGRLLAGANAITGEWGHNPLPWPSADERPVPPCYCGQNGCIETFLSGPGLSRDHHQHTGESLTPGEINDRAARQDPRAETTLRRYEARLARALASVINILDPHIIVLGGGLSNLERLYENVPKLWGKHVFSDTVATRLSRAEHGDSSGVRGAAWL